MTYDYQYEDRDHVYTDPNTGVLRNKLGIDDAQRLQAAEDVEVMTRLIDLKRNPILVKSADTLLAIHGYIFQDLYEWAGKIRVVEISKQGRRFQPVSHIHTGFDYVDKLVAEFRTTDGDLPVLSKKLALILDSINILHPFREGNGRAQREFIRVLALEKGYRLDLNPADDSSVYDRYMNGTIEGDVELLASLIESIMVKI